jgi:hypothetical protein
MYIVDVKNILLGRKRKVYTKCALMIFEEVSLNPRIIRRTGDSCGSLH